MFCIGVEKIPWRTEWQLTPVLLPESFRGRRSPEGCGPWGHSQARPGAAQHTRIRPRRASLLPAPSCPAQHRSALSPAPRVTQRLPTGGFARDSAHVCPVSRFTLPSSLPTSTRPFLTPASLLLPCRQVRPDHSSRLHIHALQMALTPSNLLHSV